MRVTKDYVLFWGGVFSNFERSAFIWDGGMFPTNEHFFMYRKAIFFEDYDTAKKILQTVHPKDAKKLGREVKNFDANKWKEVCTIHMKAGLVMKFGQNPDLLEELLKYPTQKFVECSPYDKIWGIGMPECDDALDESKWQGENLLGKCLTEVRDEFLKAHEALEVRN